MNVETPDILYHGTTREYHDRVVEKFGRYQHPDYATDSKIHFSFSAYTAAGYAMQRAKAYHVSPLLIIAKTELIINADLQWIPRITCDHLDPEWYKTLDMTLREGKLTDDDVQRITAMTKETRNLK